MPGGQWRCGGGPCFDRFRPDLGRGRAGPRPQPLCLAALARAGDAAAGRLLRGRARATDKNGVSQRPRRAGTRAAMATTFSITSRSSPADRRHLPTGKASKLTAATCDCSGLLTRPSPPARSVRRPGPTRCAPPGASAAPRAADPMQALRAQAAASPDAGPAASDEFGGLPDAPGAEDACTINALPATRPRSHQTTAPDRRPLGRSVDG